MLKSQTKKLILTIGLFICLPTFSESKTVNECVGSNVLTGTLAFLSGVATSELIDWIKEAIKYKPDLETIIKDFEVCEIRNPMQIQSLKDLTNLDPNEHIATCYTYSPYHRELATNKDRNFITVDILIEKMFSGNYVLSEEKLFFGNFSNIVTILNHLEKLYNLGEN